MPVGTPFPVHQTCAGHGGRNRRNASFGRNGDCRTLLSVAVAVVTKGAIVKASSQMSMGVSSARLHFRRPQASDAGQCNFEFFRLRSRRYE